ncbi:MAG: hypothetical protein J0L51_08940 [Rhizobiales bacterium]|nr:hypothetical protein [Hyphomicrobiales bacterium]
MNLYLGLAGVLALAVCLTHLILGGREIVRPFLGFEKMPGIARYTMYYCWHLVTITLAGMTLAFFLAAQPGGSRALAVSATIGAASFAALNFGMNLRLGLSFIRHPQGFLFVPVAIVGAIGLWFA